MFTKGADMLGHDCAYEQGMSTTQSYSYWPISSA